MLFAKTLPPTAVFRRNWGADQAEPITKIKVALDAITPSNDDCSMRIIYRDQGGYAVSVAFYSDIYFKAPIRKVCRVQLTDVVVDELKTKGYIIPFSLFVAPGKDPTMWAVSDLGESAWAQMIGH